MFTPQSSAVVFNKDAQDGKDELSFYDRTPASQFLNHGDTEARRDKYLINYLCVAVSLWLVPRLLATCASPVHKYFFGVYPDRSVPPCLMGR